MKRYHLFFLFFHKVAVILKNLKTPAIGNSWSLSRPVQEDAGG